MAKKTKKKREEKTRICRCGNVMRIVENDMRTSSPFATHAAFCTKCKAWFDLNPKI